MVGLVHGLRHFVRWRHPRLLLKELTLDSSAPLLYEANLSVLETNATQAHHATLEEP